MDGCLHKYPGRIDLYVRSITLCELKGLQEKLLVYSVPLIPYSASSTWDMRLVAASPAHPIPNGRVTDSG